LESFDELAVKIAQFGFVGDAGHVEILSDGKGPADLFRQQQIGPASARGSFRTGKRMALSRRDVGC
jgi:hypothetical protein